MRKAGNKKVIKTIVKRNLQAEKRRNIMLVVSIAFSIIFNMLFRTNCDFTDGSAEKTDSGYIRSSIYECFRRKVVKAKRRKGI